MPTNNIAEMDNSSEGKTSKKTGQVMSQWSGGDDTGLHAQQHRLVLTQFSDNMHSPSIRSTPESILNYVRTKSVSQVK